MARPRWLGSSPLTSLPSMTIWPASQSSSPAITLSSVDLPQPDGPRMTTNSPSSISMSTDCRMVSPAEDFLIWRSDMLDMFNP